MLCRMASWLSGNVGSLHLDNDTAKVYLCNQGSTASNFLFETSLLHFNLAGINGFNLLPAYLPTHLKVEAEYLSQVRFVPEWHLLLT